MYGFASDMCHTHGMPHACHVEVKWLMDWLYIWTSSSVPVEFQFSSWRASRRKGKGMSEKKERKERESHKEGRKENEEEKKKIRRKEKGKKGKEGGTRREQNHVAKDSKLRYER